MGKKKNQNKQKADASASVEDTAEDLANADSQEEAQAEVSPAAEEQQVPNAAAQATPEAAAETQEEEGGGAEVAATSATVEKASEEGEGSPQADTCPDPESSDADDDEEVVVELPPSELQLALQTELAELDEELVGVQKEAEAAEAEMAANPTVEFFEKEHSELAEELRQLSEESELLEQDTVVLKAQREQVYALSARTHRLENYVIRCGMWVDGTLKADVETEGRSAQRSAELKIMEHVMLLQSARHKQQRSLLELKDQVHQNAAQLTQGHTRVPRQEERGFEKVNTAREGGFSRMSTARTPKTTTSRAQDLHRVNDEASHELVELRQKANQKTKERSQLLQEIKRTKDNLSKDLRKLEGDLHGFKSLVQRDKRKVAELENANVTTTSTIEFLMGSLKVLTGRSFTEAGGQSQRSQVTQSSARRLK